MIPESDPCWSREGVCPLPLDRLLDTSDAISLHLPLLETTRHLINAQALSRMKIDAVLINTARGGVVDEKALSAALKAGRLGGAIMDVFGQEPLEQENSFHQVPGLILTPHIAGITQESNLRVSQMTADNIRRALKEK